MKFDTTITMSRFVFPAMLSADEQDGGFVVTFRDLPEAITQGDSLEQALSEAADCVEEAIAARIDNKLDVPEASQPEGGEYLVSVPVQTALKAALYIAMREKGMTKMQLVSIRVYTEKGVVKINLIKLDTPC
ncbi:MAG: type II toxin-antitoxin system HicB family antitoxin [Scytonema sp. PMC 1069.18]|nr:type II toxin-antitoxin system HicB family antitoxin [Scytonema sp. PMC 1069.18]MEC4883825.1 type II toxin-antitoxin system HicB family antitoxin [Scytonema sp. PMC 1070.18]